MTTEEFSAIFFALAVQMRASDADHTAMLAYHEVLKDCDLGHLQTAALMIARTYKYFPKTSEWLEEADNARKTFLRKMLPASRVEAWHHDCLACADTGWEYFHCPEQPCDRKNVHGPHDYVRECPCRPTNATYQRHHLFRKGEVA